MVTLNHPAQGNTNWFTPVDNNWSTLEQALTFGVGRIPFSDGTTLTSSSSLFWDNTNSRLGVGTGTPRRRVDILDASNPQLRLSNVDNSVYSEFLVAGDGSISILPTGSTIIAKAASPTFALQSSSTNQAITLRYDDNATTLKGQLLYAGNNTAGNRYFGFVNNSADYLAFFTVNNTDIQFSPNSTLYLLLKNTGSAVFGNAALATTATDGFLYIATCAGAPTGVPTAFTGRVAMIYDTTNNNFYIYNGAWKKVTLA
jgi:hypothetical protein